jgi:hypothetical protein
VSDARWIAFGAPVASAAAARAGIYLVSRTERRRNAIPRSTFPWSLNTTRSARLFWRELSVTAPGAQEHMMMPDQANHPNGCSAGAERSRVTPPAFPLLATRGLTDQNARLVQKLFSVGQSRERRAHSACVRESGRPSRHWSARMRPARRPRQSNTVRSLCRPGDSAVPSSVSRPQQSELVAELIRSSRELCLYGWGPRRNGRKWPCNTTAT